MEPKGSLEHPRVRLLALPLMLGFLVGGLLAEPAASWARRHQAAFGRPPAERPVSVLR